MLKLIITEDKQGLCGVIQDQIHVYLVRFKRVGWSTYITPEKGGGI